MKTFAEWCQHYDYDEKSTAAKEDYQKYSEKLDFFRAQLEKRDKSNEG